MMEKKLPRGIRNNNPLNIRKGNNWKGEVSSSTDGEFEQFVSMQMGIRAGFKILKNYMTGYGGRVKHLPIFTISSTDGPHPTRTIVKHTSIRCVGSVVSMNMSGYNLLTARKCWL